MPGKIHYPPRDASILGVRPALIKTVAITGIPLVGVATRSVVPRRDMMILQDGHTYLLPDGRRLRAHRELFASMAEPAWTLVPVHTSTTARSPLVFLARCIYVERGKLYRFELRDRCGVPKPIVQDTGWTTRDLVDPEFSACGPALPGPFLAR